MPIPEFKSFIKFIKLDYAYWLLDKLHMKMMIIFNFGIQLTFFSKNKSLAFLMLRTNDVTDKDLKLTKKREKYEKRIVENDKKEMM